MKSTHPEIETGNASTELDKMHTRDDLISTGTTLDLLEIYQKCNAKTTVEWKRNLDHSLLLKHFKNLEGTVEVDVVPALRIFFLTTVELGPVRAHPATLDWLHNRFSVSPIFLECLINPRRGASGKTGYGCFRRCNGLGQMIAIDGFYPFTYRKIRRPALVWFSYDVSVSPSSVTYIMVDCPEGAKEAIVDCAIGTCPELLFRPCAVDAFSADTCSSEWATQIARSRDELVELEQAGVSQPASSIQNIEALHHLSRHWHAILGDLEDFEELLEFLLSIHQKHKAIDIEVRERGKAIPSTTEYTSVDESLTFMISRSRTWKRWVAKYNERTKIRIGLFFNLASQNDNKTNIQIADLTSKIAIETQRDSSAMITIAAVTTFFLPGTFVSSIFSMGFFSYGRDADGRVTFAMSRQIWYYIVVTVPLTILVFAMWIFWRRRMTRHRSTKIGFMMSRSLTL